MTDKPAPTRLSAKDAPKRTKEATTYMIQSQMTDVFGLLNTSPSETNGKSSEEDLGDITLMHLLLGLTDVTCLLNHR